MIGKPFVTRDPGADPNIGAGISVCVVCVYVYCVCVVCVKCMCRVYIVCMVHIVCVCGVHVFVYVGNKIGQSRSLLWCVRGQWSYSVYQGLGPKQSVLPPQNSRNEPRRTTLAVKSPGGVWAQTKGRRGLSTT